jgi:hypothetical protein
MNPPRVIHYTNGTTVENPVVQIWYDMSAERPGFYRAYWCASPDAESGSPVVGYCSPGGSYRTIRATVADVLRRYPDAQCYRNGRRIGAAGREE